MKKILSPRILMIISMLIFGTISIFVRNINVSTGEIALYRAIIASVAIGLFLLITKRKINFKSIKKQLPLLFISGAAIGVNWILLFQAYRYTTVSIATLSNYFAPVLVTIICPIIFHEKLTIKQIICFIMSTVGIILIIGIQDNNNNNNNLIGILLGLGAAVCYASVIIINKFIKNVDDITRTFLQFISIIIFLLPYVLLTSGFNIHTLNFTGLIYLLIVGIVHTGITYCLYFSSLKNLKGQTAAILSYIDPLFAVLISVIVLQEAITFWQILGGILILGFTLLNEISIKKN